MEDVLIARTDDGQIRVDITDPEYKERFIMEDGNLKNIIRSLIEVLDSHKDNAVDDYERGNNSECERHIYWVNTLISALKIVSAI